MPNIIRNVMNDYINHVKMIYGDHLKQIILYGSYARGDNKPDSDIDIMILVDSTDEEIKRTRIALSDATYDFNMDNDLMVMPIVKNKEHFSRWVRAYPFYNNIAREGIDLYVS